MQCYTGRERGGNQQHLYSPWSMRRRHSNEFVQWPKTLEMIFIKTKNHRCVCALEGV
ncbi:unnamed protein product [Acanthoscelides obtectus]|uniref:Uncharacterized protein n=1 Tax=Acanthoscelides obtectus TaxID=200917 RepID=A0A9P0QAT9_ACAOB|nr:unnamed protein product [Acanthoscelides obtectus]CAK1651283.1 hypothetical protein AOBTE_LOCUS17152 [Acanthoscelides obtectus]